MSMKTTGRLLGFLLLVLSMSAGCKEEATPVADTGAVDKGPGGDAGQDGKVKTDAKGKDGQSGKDLSGDGKPDAKLPAHWTVVAGAMPQLEDHAATLLANGDVLIVGGDKYDGANDDYQDKAYRYVVATSKFVDAGQMTTPRANHTATLLSNGMVLVTGGKNDKDYLKSTELFDPTKPAALAWTKGPNMYTSRWDHAAVLLKTGWVLITGGFTSSDSTSAVVLYDPSTNSMKTPAQSLIGARRGHVMTLLGNGKVLITGGLTGSSWSNYAWLKSTEIYDPATGTFSAGKDMSKRRTGHTATLRNDGTVLIVGGYCGGGCTGDAYKDDLYDPAKDSITPIAHPGSLPSSHTAALLNDGRVIVMGANTSNDMNTVVAFSPTMGGVWDTLPDMPQGRWAASAFKLAGGVVLVVCGVTSSTPTYTYADKALLFHP